MSDKVQIRSVNISEKKGTIKHPVDSIRLTETGVECDAHSGAWNRQVSLLGMESIRKFEQEAGRKVLPGEFAENITTEGIELWKLRPLDRFTCGNVELEVTQIGKECHGTSCAIFKEVGNCVMPKEGIFCRVVTPGIIKPGDELAYHPKVFSIRVITLSDRASRGEYEDKSGPRIIELLEHYFSILHLPSSILHSLIPDDPEKLRTLLDQARSEKTDLVITTGGTGIGPKDFTPDVVKPYLDKDIPGIMEMIRMKYGAQKPQALVSRSIAGVMQQTLVFTLPGSVKAVNEYMAEITPTLLHLISMLHGLDAH
ncbi:MAG: molybdopterin-binding protein [Bacteroidetes bacterium]|nr:molybdopterin-binding protein [Bacteroidota bacterium]